MQNKHWTPVQPPLTGAHKNNVSKSNKRQYFTEKKNLVDYRFQLSTFNNNNTNNNNYKM